MSALIELLAPPAARAVALPLSLLHGAAFPDDPWSPQAIFEITGITGFFGLLAREEAQPVGFALVYGAGEEYEIAALGVVPERRRNGIGAGLLEAVRSEARHRGARSIVLEVAADNTAARALYAESGFARAGWRRNYYCRGGRALDALVLRLALP